MTNKEIVDNNLDLIRRCIDYQFSAVKDDQFKEDFYHDLLLILYEYPNLSDAYENGHLNALVTRVIINNIWSSTSRYYSQYKKWMDRTDPIEEIIRKDDTD